MKCCEAPSEEPSCVVTVVEPEEETTVDPEAGSNGRAAKSSLMVAFACFAFNYEILRNFL